MGLSKTKRGGREPRMAKTGQEAYSKTEAIAFWGACHVKGDW
jgi:hypothetical protein